METAIKKSEKYGSEYMIPKKDATYSKLLFRALGSNEDWVEVDERAFNEKERKEFDKEIKRIFGEKIDY